MVFAISALHPDVLARVLSEQNPWHGSGQVPATLAPPVERSLAGVLERDLQRRSPRRYHLVLGPRRVGKTTAMYQAVRRLLESGLPPQRLWWLRLDHPLLMRVPLDELVRAVVDLSRARPDQPVVLLLDELVYAADWDLWLKTFYDEQWPIALAGTSSATAALRERRLESGVGRWTERYLAPYLLPEYLELVGEGRHLPVAATLAETLEQTVEQPPELAGVARRRMQLLLTGGFPELLTTTAGDRDDEARLLESQAILRSDAVERAIYKDIPQSFGVDNPLALERLLYILADQTAGLLSPTRLAQQMDSISQPTLDRYISYLERAFMLFTLPNYSGSESARQRRGRKLYFVDVAVRNAALQRGIAPLTDSIEMGALLETQAAAHLHSLAARAGPRLYHWRDGSDEVDLVYDQPDHPLAFEIASSRRHGLRGLQRFAEGHPRFAGRCWLVAQDAPAVTPRQSPDGIGRLPLDLFLLAVGTQAEQALIST